MSQVIIDLSSLVYGLVVAEVSQHNYKKYLFHSSVHSFYEKSAKTKGIIKNNT